ncbi:MAG: dihydrofolate reductase family protein [Cyclobacteriaceae bacterium]
MRNIVYYVAISLDGYICGPNEDISGFVQEGSGVEEYLTDLKEFDTVIMGRRTYEFGYQFGLVPGQPAYPHMDHYIFSESLKFENPSDKVNVIGRDLDFIKALKDEAGSDIYLCGGAIFAGWLLEHKLIDRLKVKINPFIIGHGTPMFVHNRHPEMYRLNQVNSHCYDHGLQISEYVIRY